MDNRQNGFTVYAWDGCLPKIGRETGTFSSMGAAVADARNQNKRSKPGTMTHWVIRNSDGVMVYNRGRVDES